ncbi:MAG: aminopeptidase P N-terminal domain-containing protein [Pseudomonadota bacterium]
MDSSVFAARRAQLAAALRAAGGGVAVIPTAPERNRNSDNDHPFRHDSSFHHLTGFDEPGSWLVLNANGASAIGCRAKNPEMEIWDGVRLGVEAAPAALGVDTAFDIETLDTFMLEGLAGAPAVWFPFQPGSGVAQQVDGWLATLRSRARSGVESPATVRDLSPLLAEMRLRKDAAELATMRRAAQISADAHARAMRFSAARFRAAPNGTVREYEIEAELLHEFRRRGAQSPAYPSIVAAAANACVLHYAASDAELRAGELCLIDAGCELDGYASDITRTFPADGRFTPAQRELYDIVLAAQQAAAAVTRPGARHLDAHHAAVRVLTQGMLDSGLLDRDVVGTLDDAIAATAYRQFYMHGTGHWLGRDVHDVGEYLSLGEAPVERLDGAGRTIHAKPSRVLEPGMVVTLEPGLYVRPAVGVPERFWHIGIRIEDDAVVTDTGCELISRGVPVEAGEIEALMNDTRAAA